MTSILMDAFFGEDFETTYEHLSFRVNGYRAVIVDGVAAGTPFFQLKFCTGPWAGLAVWFEADEHGFIEYQENVNSDGFGFNWRDPIPERIDCPVEGDLLPLQSGTYLSFEVDNG